MAYNCPHCKEAIPDAVSKGELTSKIDKHNTLTSALEKQLTDMEKQINGAERKHKADLQTLREELTTGHSSALAMARLGLDDDAAAVAELLHNRLPADGRPSLTNWLQGQKDDPEKAHPLLKTYFGETKAAPAVTTSAAEETRTAVIPPVTGKPANGTPPQYTPEMIANMTDAEYLANIGALSNVAGFDIAGALGLTPPQSS